MRPLFPSLILIGFRTCISAEKKTISNSRMPADLCITCAFEEL